VARAILLLPLRVAQRGLATLGWGRARRNADHEYASGRFSVPSAGPRAERGIAPVGGFIVASEIPIRAGAGVRRTSCHRLGVRLVRAATSAMTAPRSIASGAARRWTSVSRTGRFRRGGLVLASLATAALFLLTATASAAVAGFTTPVRLGYPAGDDWEPAVASDGAGNVYVFYNHIGGVPGCRGCGNPSNLIQVSHDGGTSFSAPKPITVNSAPQFDPQVKVNSLGYVFVSFLLGKNTVIQRSADHGATWTNPIVVNVGMRQGPTDKDGLAVDGKNVYVGFNVAQRFFVAVSHDSGNTFTVSQMNSHTIGWTLSGGAAVGPDGSVYMSWEAVHQSGNARGSEDVIVTSSHDHGTTWSLSYVDRDLPPGPACGWPQTCGWSFLGTESQIAVDAAGVVYDLYSAPTDDQGSPHIWLKTSSDGGRTWTAQRQMIDADGTPAWHVFPTIDAGASGDVRVAWMDNRTGMFNVWYTSSSDGGVHWAPEVQVSQFYPGYAWITQQGFAFPYGDYFVLDLDPNGTVHLAWGEGPDWIGPGNVFYARS
jgi:hypothetical protein